MSKLARVPWLPLLFGLLFVALVVGLGLLAEGLDEGWWD